MRCARGRTTRPSHRSTTRTPPARSGGAGIPAVSVSTRRVRMACRSARACSTEAGDTSQVSDCTCPGSLSGWRVRPEVEGDVDHFNERKTVSTANVTSQLRAPAVSVRGTNGSLPFTMLGARSRCRRFVSRSAAFVAQMVALDSLTRFEGLVAHRAKVPDTGVAVQQP